MLQNNMKPQYSGSFKLSYLCQKIAIFISHLRLQIIAFILCLKMTRDTKSCSPGLGGCMGDSWSLLVKDDG